MSPVINVSARWCIVILMQYRNYKGVCSKSRRRCVQVYHGRDLYHSWSVKKTNTGSRKTTINLLP